jgi:hypothetical protein
VFLTVLHRRFSGGSDRAADRWREDYRIDGVENLDLHHLYRAMARLGKELAEDQQHGATPFAPRCLKDVEEELFARRRNLFSTLAFSPSANPARFSIPQSREPRRSRSAFFAQALSRPSCCRSLSRRRSQSALSSGCATPRGGAMEARTFLDSLTKSLG